MARPKNADLLAAQRQKVSYAKKWRRDEGYDDLWRRLIDLYQGKQYEHLSAEDRLLVNVSFSTINIISPSVAVNYPKITVNANKADAAPMAIITEAVVNYWWRRYEVRPEFRRSVKDSLIIGIGWMKVGWRFVEEDEVAEGEDISDVDGEDGTVSSPDTPNTVIVEDRPFVERVSPFDVFVDPDSTSERDMGWIAQRVRRTLREVHADKRYNAAARKNCSPGSWRNAEDGAATHHTDRAVDKDEQYVEVWEFYDLKRKTVSVFAEGGDVFLVSPTPIPYTFGHPFVSIRNYDVPERFYPMGDLEAIEPLQRELNATRTQMMNHRKKYSRKYLFREGAFDQKARGLLQSDADNVMVPVKGDENMNDLVVPVQAVITPPEFYNQSDLIQADIRNITAVSEYMAGQMPEMRRTATEAGIIADAANARAADKLATIELAIAAVAKRLVQLAQTFMDSEQVARVIGNDGQPRWVEFDADYIAGDFDFEVEAGSTQPNNESFRRQSALQIVDAMTPFMQAGVVDMQQLAAHVLQFGFDVKNPQKFLTQPPAATGAEVPPEAEMPPEMPPPEMAM